MKQYDKLSSTKKAIFILDVLSQEPYAFTAIEISKKLSLNRSTVHRMLNDFIEQKYVIQNKYTKKYKLGPATFRLGACYQYMSNFDNDVITTIYQVAEKTKESVGYYVKDGDTVISLYETEYFQVNPMGYKPGVAYPINAGTAGKCIIAFLDDEEIREILARTTLHKYTPTTITDPEMLMKEYETVRMQGYCESKGDRDIEKYGIAAPIRNSKGQVFACIALACFRKDLSKEKEEFLKATIIQAAQEISELMI